LSVTQRLVQPVQRRAQIPQETLLDFMNFIVQLGGLGLLWKKINTSTTILEIVGKLEQP
jgi:hypothetical protein